MYILCCGNVFHFNQNFLHRLGGAFELRILFAMNDLNLLLCLYSFLGLHPMLGHTEPMNMTHV